MSSFIDKVPLLTDRQEGLAREHGVCPACDRQALVELGHGHGMRFVGCGNCQTLVVLPPAIASDRLLEIPGARDHGRVYLSQRIGLAMRDRNQVEPGPRLALHERNYVGQGLRLAEAIALSSLEPGTTRCEACEGKGVLYQCVVCCATKPRTGTCSGPHDPRALCNGGADA